MCPAKQKSSNAQKCPAPISVTFTDRLSNITLILHLEILALTTQSSAAPLCTDSGLARSQAVFVGPSMSSFDDSLESVGLSHCIHFQESGEPGESGEMIFTTRIHNDDIGTV